MSDEPETTTVINPTKPYMYTCISCGVIVSQSQMGWWMGSPNDGQLKKDVRKACSSLHNNNSGAQFDCQKAHLFHESVFDKNSEKGNKTRSILFDKNLDGRNPDFSLGDKWDDLNNSTIDANQKSIETLDCLALLWTV